MLQEQDQGAVESDWKDRELESEDEVESVPPRSDSVKKQLHHMEKNPSLASVLAVGDALVLANRIGFKAMCPIEYRAALEAARRVARSLDAAQLRVGISREGRSECEAPEVDDR